jgi:CheY-like chemotaxis protein
MRILIVDDNRDAADSLACLLELHHFDVRVAYDGTVGQEIAHSFAPDCMLTDISMPGVDGYELARRFRADPALAGVKLVALSAMSNEEHVQKATAAGFDFRLTKGCDLDKVLEVLKMIEHIKDLATKTQELAKHNVELAGQTKELLQEVKQDIKEVKQEVRELKQDVKDLKKEQKEKHPDDNGG